MPNLLREALEKKKKISGTLVSLTDPGLCEIVGAAGYDCVWIDMEHTCNGVKEVLCHLNAARAAGISSLVRLPQNDLTVTKQVLELGPDGVLFPMVRNRKEAEDLIAMTLYPPLGTRGFGPMRAIRYGADDAKKYAEKDSLSLCRFLQIESVGCLNELEEIARIPYVDGFIFGPNDLSGSLGEFLNVFGDKTGNAMRDAVKILRKCGKPFGIACGFDPETLRHWSNFAPDMLFAGADWNFVYQTAKNALADIRKELHMEGKE